MLFAVTTNPFPTIEIIAAVLLSALAGILCKKGSVLALRSAKAVTWLNAIGGLIWAMAFAPDMFLGAWLAGVFAYGLILYVQRILLFSSPAPLQG